METPDADGEAAISLNKPGPKDVTDIEPNTVNLNRMDQAMAHSNGELDSPPGSESQESANGPVAVSEGQPGAYGACMSR